MCLKTLLHFLQLLATMIHNRAFDVRDLSYTLYIYIFIKRFDNNLLQKRYKCIFEAGP